MSGWTVAWLAGLAYIVGLELFAYFRGGYWATLTGHLERFALSHPLAAVVLFGLLAALVAHLAIDYVVLRLRP